ncbi:glycine, alanine and asparagine-rich protein-like [Gossypium australe]|uniref:Glycine, alanine and asparagine-rich protein-like n=1 Tax=Gossypium australe TaxID=47621 RepID=A0A5B6VHY1_9ROSI|nr:glycine, alanine and asparagine-rich protein-like [Gossypium australe]
MRLAMTRRKIRGVKASRSGPQISHLLFTDDYILFMEATERGAHLLKQILHEYEICSGQSLNYTKSTIFFSTNTKKGERRTTISVLRVRSSNDPEQYLGLPNMVVLQSIPTYSMACFLLPKSLCAELDGIIAKFWWQKSRVSYNGGSMEVNIESKNTTSRDISKQISSYISELKGIEERTLILKEDRGPKHDDRRTTVAIYFDAAFDQQAFKYASGLVVRDVGGKILASKSVIHSDVASPFAAEAHARLQATKLGISMGFNVLEIVGNSRTVIKKCQNTNCDRSIIGALIRDI